MSVIRPDLPDGVHLEDEHLVSQLVTLHAMYKQVSPLPLLLGIFGPNVHDRYPTFVLYLENC